MKILVETMLQRTVMKSKDSLIIAIPKQVCGILGIKKGDILNVELNGNKIIFAPAETLPQTTAGAASTTE